MKTGLLVIPDIIDNNIKWDHNVDYTDSLHILDSMHEFRTWHSYAAVTKGKAMVYGMPGWEQILDCDLVIIAIFNNIHKAIDPILQLKSNNIVVGIAYHESLQMLQYVTERNIKYFSDLCDVIKISNCDFLLYSTPKQSGLIWESLYDLENIPVQYVPFAYPMHIMPEYRISINDRNGIFISYNNQSSLMKNHITALLISSQLVKKHNTYAVIISDNENIHHYDSWFYHDGINRLKIYPTSDYHNFLHILSQCKMCLSLDYSLSQGQIAFDSTIVNIPCIGGSTDGQRILFPELAFDTTDMNIITNAANKCFNDTYNQTMVEIAIKNMSDYCSFDIVKHKLESIYETYKNKGVQ